MKKQFTGLFKFGLTSLIFVQKNDRFFTYLSEKIDQNKKERLNFRQITYFKIRLYF